MPDDAYANKPSPLMAKIIVPVHTFLYRISHGKIGATMGGAPVLLLTVAGRKTGKLRTLPLVYIPTDKGYAVIASKGGAPTHPAWYLNLEAASSAVIQIGGDKMKAKILILHPGNERYEAIWKSGVAIFPGYEDYKRATTREFPIVELLSDQQ